MATRSFIQTALLCIWPPRFHKIMVVASTRLSDIEAVGLSHTQLLCKGGGADNLVWYSTGSVHPFKMQQCLPCRKTVKYEAVLREGGLQSDPTCVYLDIGSTLWAFPLESVCGNTISEDRLLYSSVYPTICGLCRTSQSPPPGAAC